MTIILDASALLCVLNGERGWEAVDAVLDDAAVSTVNLSEVVAKLAERGVPGDLLPTQLAGSTLAIVPFDAAEAYTAGKLRPVTRRAGLSFGDRACLALAISRGAAVLTADRRMAEPPLGLDVRVIR